MKKNVLLFLALIVGFIPAVAQQQFPVWSDDFNDEDVSDWQLIDEDEDGKNWQTNGFAYLDNTTFTVTYDPSHKVLASYSADFETFNFFSNYDNWAISPEISLEVGGGYTYGGTLTLMLDAQAAVSESGSPAQLDIYVATNPDVDDLEASFTYAGPLNLSNPNPDNGPYPAQFTNYELDITEFIAEGTTDFYIALRHTDTNEGTTTTYGFEIDEITLQASELVLATEKYNLTNIELIQNPVKERLLLSNRANLEPVQVEVYDMTGKKLMENTYSKNGLDVSNLANGVYMARITNAKAATTLKFIKQ